jgi:dipeptidase E
MKAIILTSYLDFYEKDEQGNKVAHNFGNDNGLLDCLKANTNKFENFLFVGNGMEGAKSEQYFKIACESFAITMPFKNYNVLNNSTKDKSKELIEKADFIFLCGGHLPTQNAFFNEIGLKELLKNTNALIVGGSAGSMNCADVVYCPPELEEEVDDTNFNRYLKGLGLTDINIMPHFEEYQQMVICGKRYIDDIVVPDSYTTDIVALNNGSFIVIKDNESTVYGESYLVRKGKITQINENNNIVNL